MGGERFDSNDEIFTQTKKCFEKFDKAYYLVGVPKLDKHWTKYIILIGDYFVK